MSCGGEGCGTPRRTTSGYMAARAGRTPWRNCSPPATPSSSSIACAPSRPNSGQAERRRPGLPQRPPLPPRAPEGARPAGLPGLRGSPVGGPRRRGRRRAARAGGRPPGTQRDSARLPARRRSRAPEVRDFRSLVSRWNDDLLPDLVTLRGRRQEEVVARLRERLAELRGRGRRGLPLQGLIDPLQGRRAGALGRPAGPGGGGGRPRAGGDEAVRDRTSRPSGHQLRGAAALPQAGRLRSRLHRTPGRQREDAGSTSPISGSSCG